MAKKLKTFQTSLGFFDQAIAAPSMKAALEAWGADSNLFHQGSAKESRDPEIIAATLAKPGVVLRRPVGSNGPFGEHAELPANLGDGDEKPAKSPGKSNRKSNGKPSGKSKAHEPKQASSRSADKATEQKAARAYQQEKQRRDREREKEDAARQKERERRQEAIAKAQAALDEAEREHAKRAGAIQAEADAIENRAQAEYARWEKQKQRLDAALKHARGKA